MACLHFLATALFEAILVVAGFNDRAMMGDAIKQSCGHFGISKDGAPFTKLQVGSDDDTGIFIEFTDEVKEQCAT